MVELYAIKTSNLLSIFLYHFFFHFFFFIFSYFDKISNFATMYSTYRYQGYPKFHLYSEVDG